MRVKLYNDYVKQLDSKMLIEIDDAVADLGGNVIEVDLDTKLIRINIDEEHEENAYGLVKIIMDRYHDERVTAMKSPFFGVTLIKGYLDDV